MRTIPALLICIISFSINLYAQEKKIDWGPEIKSYSTNEFLGDDEMYLYLLNSENASFHSKKHRILKIDKHSKEMVDLIEFKKKLKPYKYIMDLQLNGGKFEAVSHQNKAIVKVIFKPDGTILDEEILHTFKNKTELNLENVSGLFYSNKKPSVTSITSKNGSKFAVRVKSSKDKTDKYMYYIYDRNDHYNLIDEFEFVIERKEKKEKLKGALLTDNGKVIFLVKEYLTNKEKEEKNNKPNYKYKLISGLSGGGQVVTELGPTDHFVKNTFNSITEDQGLIITSLTETKPDKGAKGLQIHKFDPDNNLVFKKYHPLKDIKTDKKNHLETYQLSTVIQCNDGAIMVVVLSMETKSRNNSSSNDYGNTQNFYYVINDILINYFDIQGNYVWSKAITRNSKELNSFYFSIPQIMVNNYGGADFYFNTDIRNVNSFEDPNADDFYLRSKENVIVKVSFTKDGSVDYRALSDQSKYGLALNAIESFGDITYFIGTDHNYKKIKIGELK